MSLSVGLFVYFNLKTVKPQERFMDGQNRSAFENKLENKRSLNPHTKPNLLLLSIPKLKLKNPRDKC